MQTHVIINFLEMKKEAEILLSCLWGLLQRCELKVEQVDWIWTTFRSAMEAQELPSLPTGPYVAPFAECYIQMMAWQILNLDAIDKLDPDVRDYVLGTGHKTQVQLKAVIEERSKKYGLTAGYEPAKHALQKAHFNAFELLGKPAEERTKLIAGREAEVRHETGALHADIERKADIEGSRHTVTTEENTKKPDVGAREQTAAHEQATKKTDAANRSTTPPKPNSWGKLNFERARVKLSASKDPVTPYGEASGHSSARPTIGLGAGDTSQRSTPSVPQQQPGLYQTPPLKTTKASNLLGRDDSRTMVPGPARSNTMQAPSHTQPQTSTVFNNVGQHQTSARANPHRDFVNFGAPAAQSNAASFTPNPFHAGQFTPTPSTLNAPSNFSTGSSTPRPFNNTPVAGTPFGNMPFSNTPQTPFGVNNTFPSNNTNTTPAQNSPFSNAINSATRNSFNITPNSPFGAPNPSSNPTPTFFNSTNHPATQSNPTFTPPPMPNDTFAFQAGGSGPSSGAGPTFGVRPSQRKKAVPKGRLGGRG
jgi:hypothetical protein